jgi:hypothetical protein
MAITTLANVKTLLNLPTGTTDDAWITALIAQVESDYEQIRGKAFDIATKLNITTTGLPADEEMEIEVGNSANVGGTASGLEYDIRLRSGDTADMIAYRIVAGMKPSGYFNFSLANASSSSADIYLTERFPSWQEWLSVLDITVTSSTSLTATASKMQTVYPKGSEMTAAQMIQYQMSKPGGMKAESLGDYSVTYDDAAGGYPKSIMGQIVRFAVTA